MVAVKHQIVNYVQKIKHKKTRNKNKKSIFMIRGMSSGHDGKLHKNKAINKRRAKGKYDHEKIL